MDVGRRLSSWPINMSKKKLMVRINFQFKGQFKPYFVYGMRWGSNHFVTMVLLNPSWKSTGSFKVNRRLKLPCEVWSLIPEEISSTAGVQFHAKWLGHDSSSNQGIKVAFLGEIHSPSLRHCVERSPSPALVLGCTGALWVHTCDLGIALVKLHSARSAPLRTSKCNGRNCGKCQIEKFNCDILGDFQ